MASSPDADLTEIKFGLSMLGTVVCGCLFRLIPVSWSSCRHFASFFGGIFIMQWVFGEDWIHSLLSSTVNYTICILGHKFPQRFPNAHTASFIWCIFYMTMSYAYRYSEFYMSPLMDFTGPQMWLTIRMTSLAFHLYQARKHLKNRTAHDSSQEAEPITLNNSSKYVKSSPVTKFPTLLEYYGYVYCFTGILAGPAVNYEVYLQGVKGVYIHSCKDLNKEDAAESDKNSDISQVSETSASKVRTKECPSSILAGLWLLGEAALCMLAQIVIGTYLPLSYMEAMRVQHNGDWSPNAYHYVFCVILLGFKLRLMFYFAWKAGESASVFAGIGYVPVKGTDIWNLVSSWKGGENVNILKCEMYSCTQEVTRAWNKTTQVWLEECVYLQSGRSLIVVYFVCALWHGLYPGKFIFFFSLAQMTMIERLIRKKINPYVIPGYERMHYSSAPDSFITPCYWVLCWAFTYLCKNMIIPFFIVGSLDNCLELWHGGHKYYYGFMVAAYAVLYLLPTPNMSGDKSKVHAA